jgi:hypothetical protein
MGIIETIFKAKQDAATAAWPSLAGKPYCPSSGTEGMAFDDAWCAHCTRDKAYRDGGDDADPAIACQILSNTMVYDVKDPEYPKEWVYGADGRPRCTAFTTDPTRPVRCDRTIDMFEQQ